MIRFWIICQLFYYQQIEKMILCPTSIIRMIKGREWVNNEARCNTSLHSLRRRGLRLFGIWLGLLPFVYFFTFWSQRCCSRHNTSIWYHRNADVAMPSCTWRWRRARACKNCDQRLPNLNILACFRPQSLRKYSILILFSFSYIQINTHPRRRLRLLLW